MIEAKRKDNETTGAFLRRFTRKVQKSRVLVKARRKRYKKDPLTKKELQTAAVKRAIMLKERARLFKLGKIDSID